VTTDPYWDWIVEHEAEFGDMIAPHSRMECAYATEEEALGCIAIDCDCACGHPSAKLGHPASEDRAT
jgi:hypothetical protein